MSLAAVPNTVNVTFELWTSEDNGGQVIYLEDNPEQNGADDFICCPIVLLTALFLGFTNTRMSFLRRTRQEGIATAVFIYLTNRMKRLSCGPLGDAPDHPLRRITILSEFANIGLKLMVDKELDFECSLSESRFFHWITSMVEAVNRQALDNLRHDRDSYDCYPVPAFSALIMNWVVNGVVHMSLRHRLKNLQYIVSAGVLQVCLSLFAPYIPWANAEDRKNLCGTALKTAVVVCVHFHGS